MASYSCGFQKGMCWLPGAGAEWEMVVVGPLAQLHAQLHPPSLPWPCQMCSFPHA